MTNKFSHHIIVVSDIFGENEALTAVALQLESACRNVNIVTPYTASSPVFCDEESAYQFFLAQGGHCHYYQHLKAMIRTISPPISIIAFSAGASALWQLVAEQKITAALGFYPSQIRHHLTLTPLCHTTLVFPAYENHFSVDNTLNSLAKTPLLQCIQTKFLHGFMNPASINFSEKGQDQYQAFIQAWLQDIEKKLNNKKDGVANGT